MSRRAATSRANPSTASVPIDQPFGSPARSAALVGSPTVGISRAQVTVEGYGAMVSGLTYASTCGPFPELFALRAEVG